MASLKIREWLRTSFYCTAPISLSLTRSDIKYNFLRGHYLFVEGNFTMALTRTAEKQVAKPVRFTADKDFLELLGGP